MAKGLVNMVILMVCGNKFARIASCEHTWSVTGHIFESIWIRPRCYHLAFSISSCQLCSLSYTCDIKAAVARYCTILPFAKDCCLHSNLSHGSAWRRVFFAMSKDTLIALALLAFWLTRKITKVHIYVRSQVWSVLIFAKIGKIHRIQLEEQLDSQLDKTNPCPNN